MEHCDLFVCVDCGMWISNGDTSGASEDWKPNLEPWVINVVMGDGEKDVEFSWRRCDVCRSHLGGYRYHAALLVEA